MSTIASTARFLRRALPKAAQRPVSSAGAHERALRLKQNYLHAKVAFNRNALDECMAFYSEDHQIRSSDVGAGKRHIRKFLADIQSAWDDLQLVVEHVVAESDLVMGHCRFTAAHTQTVMGFAPTGRRIETTFWDLHRFNEDELICETWNITDLAAVMRQLTDPMALGSPVGRQ